MKPSVKDDPMFVFAVISMLSYGALGITLPVMNLVFLEEGANLSSLAVLMAVYSAIIVATEIPSGIASDLYGRKAAFLFSKVCTIIGSIVLICATKSYHLAIVVVFLGLARSFSSGSFEALIIDWHNETYGIDALHKITTSLSVWDTAGLSAGTLLSGFISLTFKKLGILPNHFLGCFLIGTIIQFIIITITVLFVKEPRSVHAKNIRQHATKTVVSGIMNNKMLVPFLMLACASGFMLSAIEKYWQPKLLEVSQTEHIASVLLGILMFVGFMGALAGTILAGKLIQGHPERIKPVLIIFRILLTLSLIGMATSTRSMMFSFAYGGFYLFLALAQIPEQTLLNRIIDSPMRASCLSASSFFLQIGGFASSIFAALYLRSTQNSILSFWCITALIGVSVLLLVLRPLVKIKS